MVHKLLQNGKAGKYTVYVYNIFIQLYTHILLEGIKIRGNRVKAAKHLFEQFALRKRLLL